MRRDPKIFLGALTIVLVIALPAFAASPNPAARLGTAATGSLPEGRGKQSRALYLTLIRDMRQSGRTHAALAHLDAFDLQYPHSNDAAVMRADCLVDIKAFAEATTIYRKLVKTETAAAAYAGLGRIEGLNERWAGAVNEFSQAVTRAPTSSTYLNDYGYALLKAGNYEQALFRTRQAAELAPNDVRARNNLILVLSATGDRAGATALLATIADPGERSDVRAAIAATATTTVAANLPGAVATRPVQALADPFAQ